MEKEATSKKSARIVAKLSPTFADPHVVAQIGLHPWLQPKNENGYVPLPAVNGLSFLGIEATIDMEHYPYVHTSGSILSMIIAMTRPESLRSNVKSKILIGNNLFHHKTLIPPNQLPVP